MPVAGAGSVGDGLDRAGSVVGGVEGELLGGFCRGPEVLCAQADGADAGALEAEEVVQLVGGDGERAGVGGGFGQRTAARAGGAVGVPDGQDEVSGRLVCVAEPGTEFLGEVEEGSSVFVGVEDVVAEGPLRAGGFRDRLALDGAEVVSVGVGVEGASGGCAEDPRQRGQGCVARSPMVCSPYVRSFAAVAGPT